MKNDVDTAVGERVTKMRLSSRISVEELAAKANIGADTLAAIEAGIRRPTPAELVAIANSLDASPSNLFPDDLLDGDTL